MSEIQLLRIDEAAGVLKISRSKTYELIAAREFPVVRIGRSVRVSRPSLERWISERTTPAVDDVGSRRKR